MGLAATADHPNNCASAATTLGFADFLSWLIRCSQAISVSASSAFRPTAALMIVLMSSLVPNLTLSKTVAFATRGLRGFLAGSGRSRPSWPGG